MIKKILFIAAILVAQPSYAGEVKPVFDMKHVKSMSALIDQIRKDDYKTIIEDSVIIHTETYSFSGKIIDKTPSFVTTATGSGMKNTETRKERYLLQHIPLANIVYISYQVYEK